MDYVVVPLAVMCYAYDLSLFFQSMYYNMLFSGVVRSKHNLYHAQINPSAARVVRFESGVDGWMWCG